MASSRLWPAIITTPIAPTTRIGSRASAASTTIDQPIAQITWRPIALQVKLKVQPTVTSDNSTTTSQSPRLTRKRVRSAWLRPRDAQRYAPVPARKTKLGAQRWVIQRVRKRSGVVRVRSVGSNSRASR